MPSAKRTAQTQLISVLTLSAIFDTDFAMDFTFFFMLIPAVILLFEASITTVPTAIPDIAPLTMLFTVLFCIFYISRFRIMKRYFARKRVYHSPTIYKLYL